MAVRTSTTNGRAVRARGQRTVRKLLDAGIEVFGEKGFHPSRVDDIARAAQTSHGTFYLYFANKEDLFGALAREVADEIRALVDSLEPITPDADGLAMLRGWVETFVDIHRRYGPVIRAWTEAEIDTSKLGRLGASVLGDFAGTFARRAAEVGDERLDATVAGMALVAMIERFCYYALTGQVRADVDAQVDTLTAVMFAALFGADAAPAR
jgi:AcrR family transcriptional regulator